MRPSCRIRCSAEGDVRLRYPDNAASGFREYLARRLVDREQILHAPDRLVWHRRGLAALPPSSAFVWSKVSQQCPRLGLGDVPAGEQPEDWCSFQC